MESRWGLVPDMGLTRSLKGLIGLDLAKELTLTARIFDGAYAKDIGLVTHLDDNPMIKAQALAEELIQRSPDALLAAKRVLDGNSASSLVKTVKSHVKKINILKLILHHVNIMVNRLITVKV